MRRREFITVMGGAAATAAVAPLAARAQPPAMPVIGVLYPNTPDSFATRGTALRQGLREAGFVEGENVTLEFRSAYNDNEKLPALAVELVRRRVSVIVAGAIPAAQAAKAATSSIPIVFQAASDPVELGLVTSLNRPGGNITGVTRQSVEIVSKRLALLREMVPSVGRFGVLLNPTAPAAQSQSQDLQPTADTLGLELKILQASTAQEIEAAFATLAELRLGALLIGVSGFFNSQSERLANLALRHAVPASHQLREFADAGGLMSYASSLNDSWRQVGVYAGRILKGEKPGDLPVEQPVKFELVINLKTAKAIGLDVPAQVLALADEVIE